MIRPLRQRHRTILCALGIILPAALVTGIAARRPVPVVASVSPELSVPAANFGKAVTKADIWPNQEIITILRRDKSGSVSVEFMFRKIVKPDVLVYWAEVGETSAAVLPDDAQLLGLFLNRAPLHIPEDLRGNTGRFLLYSLADHEIVASSRPFTIQRFNDSTF